MELMWLILAAISSLALTIGGATMLLFYSARVTQQLPLPEKVAGLVLLGFGTSIPELFVSFLTGFTGQDEVVLGNVIGSNIFNILFILGLLGLIFPFTVNRQVLRSQNVILLLSGLLLLLLVNDVLLFSSATNSLSQLDGFIFRLICIIYLAYTINIPKLYTRAGAERRVYLKIIPRFHNGSGAKLGVILRVQSEVSSKVTWCIFIGLLLMALGTLSFYTVAVDISRQFQLPETLVAFLVIPASTSTPELITSALALFKKRNDLAVGTILGTNTFNILFIMGLVPGFEPVNYNIAFNLDLAILLSSTVALFLALFIGRVNQMTRWKSSLFILGYIGYVVWLIRRLESH